MGNKEAFMEHHASNFRALTLDELRIRNEQVSHVNWQDVDISGHLSRNYEAPVPIIASPMTTISGVEMAIAMAMLGGAAAIPHHIYTPQEQYKMLREVKHQFKTKINDPITAQASQSLPEILDRISKSAAKPTTLPVLGADGRFVGLLDSMRFNLYGKDTNATAEDRMIPADKVVTADPSTDVNRAYEIMRERGVDTLPLVDPKTQEVKGMYLLGDVMRSIEGTNYNVDKNGRLITMASVSTFEDQAIERVKVIHPHVDIIIMDTSHGEHHGPISAFTALREAIKVIKTVREDIPNIDIIIGNISDANTALALAKLDPDGIRTGQGPGGICISGEVLGGGAPQATAIYETAKAVNSYNPEIVISGDGGMTGPADMTKARALGAGNIMVGSLISATNETPGEVVRNEDGVECKPYNGQGSATEQARANLDGNRYEDDSQISEIFVEGVEKLIPLKGPVAKVINNAVTGMKKQMSASGFPDVATMQRDVSFWRAGASGIRAAGASK